MAQTAIRAAISHLGIAIERESGVRKLQHSIGRFARYDRVMASEAADLVREALNLADLAHAPHGRERFRRAGIGSAGNARADARIRSFSVSAKAWWR
jgi:hypothetical protein